MSKQILEVLYQILKRQMRVLDIHPNYLFWMDVKILMAEVQKLKTHSNERTKLTKRNPMIMIQKMMPQKLKT